VEDFGIAKPNRRRRQEKKPHRQVIHRPMGLPKWERSKSRKEHNKKIATITKKARGKGLPKRQR
jgi:hypothetical protein